MMMMMMMIVKVKYSRLQIQLWLRPWKNCVNRLNVQCGYILAPHSRYVAFNKFLYLVTQMTRLPGVALSSRSCGPVGRRSVGLSPRRPDTNTASI